MANINKETIVFDFDGIGIDALNKEAELLSGKHSNPYPIDVFPDPFRSLMEESNRCLNFPLDYIGTALLTAVGLTVGKSAKIAVKNGWNEFPALFTGLVGSPGVNKSHALKMAFLPFEEIDGPAIAAYATACNEYEQWEKLSKKERQTTAPVNKPTLKKNVLHNFTPEILYQRLSDSDVGCAIVSDELGTFLDGMNNYSRGDTTTTYLSIFNNQSTSIDRVGKNVPLWLPQPFLCIVGTLQPRMLPQLFPAKKINNGFLQRFLFAYPDYAEKQPINDYEISNDVIRKYKEWIIDYRSNTPLSIDSHGNLSYVTYQWSSEAKEYFYDWQAKNTKKVNEAGDSLLAEILSKYDIHFPRLALIMQIMAEKSGNTVQESACIAAEKLCSYYQKSASKITELIGQDTAPLLRTQNKMQLFEALPDVFSTAEGLQIATGIGIPERTFKRELANGKLFTCLEHGKYQKVT